MPINPIDVPEEFLCPITRQIMEQPVIATDGHTYEKTAIVRWFEDGHNTSPMTGERLRNNMLTDNFNLKSQINSFKDNLPQLQREQQIQTDFYEALKLREEMLAQHLKKEKGLEQQEEDEEELTYVKREASASANRKLAVVDDNSGMANFDGYLELLFGALDSRERGLVTKEDILKAVTSDEDDKELEQSSVYRLIREKLGNDSIEILDARLTASTENLDDLYSTVKAIYRHRQTYEPNIMDFINKTEDYFVGKFFEFEDPNANQSTLSRIETCEFYKSRCNEGIKFSLENRSVFFIEYNNREVVGVETAFKRRASLIDLLKNHVGKRGCKLERIEFFRQREELVEDGLRIEPGIYDAYLTNESNDSWQLVASNLFKSKKDRLRQQKLTLSSLEEKKRLDYTFLITTNLRNAQEFAIVKQDMSLQELSVNDFHSIVCNVIEGKKKINFGPSNAVSTKKYFRIKEMETEISKENQKRQEINDIEDRILGFLRADEHETYLYKLVASLASNALELPVGVAIDKELQKDVDRICALFQGLNIESSKEMVLKTAAIEALYAKLVDKHKKLAMFKVMDLLEEAYKHINSVTGKDLVFFWGGTGAGKSVSINYYLGHALETYQNYGRPYVRLKDRGLMKEGTYAKIGQSIAISETTFIHGYKPQDRNLKNLMLCDCPGFEDSRGEAYDLSTMISIDQAIKNANSIKAVVLTIAYEDFWGSRCRSVIKLFEHIKERVPEVFTKKAIRESIFLLVTKYNKNEPLEKNLKLAVADALSDERSMLYHLKNKKTSEDNVQIKTIEEKIETWNFILDIINSKRIITVDVRDKAQRRECLQNFLNVPGIDRNHFIKAMDSDSVQRSFSKYIYMHVDTWKKHILSMYVSKLPQQIYELNTKIDSMRLHIASMKQKNEGVEKFKLKKQEEIKEILVTNERLKELLSVNDEKLIAKEIIGHATIEKSLLTINQGRLAQLGVDVQENEERAAENVRKIEELKKENEVALAKIEGLKTENADLGSGNTTVTLFERRQLEADEEMTLIRMTDESWRERVRCFNSVTEHNAEGTEEKCVAGSYTGILLHDVFVDKDYYIVPNDVTSFDDLRDKLYDKDFFQEGRRYKATIGGEGWEFDLGVKAHPDRKKMVYSIRTRWRAGETIPWFSITHDLPNVELNEARIINNEAEIKLLQKQCLENSKEIDRLDSKNLDLKRELDVKNKNIKELEEEIITTRTEYNHTHLQEIISRNEELVETHTKGIDMDDTEIKSNLSVIESDSKTIDEALIMLKGVILRKLHLAVIIKSKIEVANLLRKFAALALSTEGLGEGLGIRKENADQDLVFDLREYASYYDANIQKILSMCDKDLISGTAYQEENVVPIIRKVELIAENLILNQYDIDRSKIATRKATEMEGHSFAALRAHWETRANRNQQPLHSLNSMASMDIDEVKSKANLQEYKMNNQNNPNLCIAMERVVMKSLGYEVGGQIEEGTVNIELSWRKERAAIGLDEYSVKAELKVTMLSKLSFAGDVPALRLEEIYNQYLIIIGKEPPQATPIFRGQGHRLGNEWG